MLKRLAVLWLGATAFGAACGDSNAEDGPPCEGWADCDGDASNGCETAIVRDESNCGGCGILCGGEHATASCVDGVCESSCDFAWADCDADMVNGCEVQLWDNAEHCGGCGQACPHAVACEEDTCVQTELYESYGLQSVVAVEDTLYFAVVGSGDGTGGHVGAVSSAGEVVTLASQGRPRSLVAEDGWIYWVAEGDGAVRRVAHEDTSTVVDLAVGLGEPGPLAIHDGWLYVGREPDLLRLPASGGVPEVLATGLANPGALAVDATGIYVALINEGVAHVPLNGGAPTVIASGYDGVIHVEVDESRVYWNAFPDGGLYAAPKGGGPATTLHEGFVTGFALDGDVAAVGDGAILRVDLTTGAAEEAAPGGHALVSLAIDGDRIAFADSNGGHLHVAPW